MNFIIAIFSLLFHLNEINVMTAFFSIIEIIDRDASKLMHNNIRMN
jgi:hypothetical protein